ncbi:MAG TPA: nucleotidyltransferase family protein [Syntrophales bacterium]|nr:nucleotidyltransferase family protein [Syntrophales bacterium]
MSASLPRFTAIVLAADREPFNEVAKAAGVSCKSLAPVDGVPMVFRVLEALRSSRYVGERIMCGPPGTVMAQEPELRDYVAAGGVRWFENQATPSASAHHVMQQLPETTPVLLTTGDHALLSPQVADFFCLQALASTCDVVAAVARHEEVTTACPETRRTSYRFKDGSYCFCNLFAFLTPQARAAALFWRQAENQRKSPMRVIRAFGWLAVMRYVLGGLTLAGAMDRVSHRLGFKAGIVILPFPEAAIDVDSVRDWYIARRIAGEKDIDHLHPFP